MSVEKKGKGYYYSFMLAGKIYRGTCKGCNNKESALQFENQIRDFVKKMRTISNEQALLLEYRKELIGAREIYLNELVELAISKPQRKQRREGENNLYRIRWKDFVLFMNEYHPRAKTAGDVLVSHAEEYVEYLTQKGAFRFSRIGNTDKRARHRLSSATILQYINVMDFVFRRTAADTGIPYSPFCRERLVRVSKNPIDREAFTPEELTAISEKMFEYPHHKWNEVENSKYPPRLGQLFMIAFYTGMRLGDCCCLKWNEVDFVNHNISVITRKTGKPVLIPIMPDLFTFLLEQKRIKEETRIKSESVFPFWAEAYKKNASTVCQRIRNFLEAIGIQTQKENANGRKQPVKSFHSFRHTFASMAMIHGVPLNVIQSIVGHSNAKMTEHYSRHISALQMRDKMSYLPGLLKSSAVPESIANVSNIKQEICTIINDMTPGELENILRSLKYSK